MNVDDEYGVEPDWEKIRYHLLLGARGVETSPPTTKTGQAIVHSVSLEGPVPTH